MKDSLNFEQLPIPDDEKWDHQTLLNKPGKNYSKSFKKIFDWFNPDGSRVGYITRMQFAPDKPYTKPKKVVWQVIYGKSQFGVGWHQVALQEKPLVGLEVLSTAKNILLVEGELTREIAQKTLGSEWAVLCVQGGANIGHFKRTDLTPLKETKLRIYAWRDNDHDGLEHMKFFLGAGLEVHLVKIEAFLLDAVKSGWDLADAIKAGWSKDKIENLIFDYSNKFDDFQTKSKIFSGCIKGAKEVFNKIRIPKDEKGNWRGGIKFFVDNLIERLIFVSDKNGFLYLYDENRYRAITKNELDNLLISFPDLESSSPDYRSKIRSLLEANVLEPNLDCLWRNISPYQIPLRNGLLNVKSKELSHHNPEHYLESVIKHSYVPSAYSKELEAFLKQTFEDDPNKILALQEFSGYTLLPKANAKKALFALGPKDSGKSVYGHCMMGLHGRENICNIPLNTIDDPVALLQLVGKNLNLVPEINYGESIPDANFKTLVGTEEPIQVRQLYVGYKSYVPYAKHIFLSNNLPLIKDPTNATIERILPIEFINVVPPNQIDVDLPKKIMSNPGGFLNWCIEGAVRLVENNFRFTMPDSSLKFISNYKQTRGSFRWFLDEYFEFESGAITDYHSLFNFISYVRNNLNGYSELASIRSPKKLTNFLDAFDLKSERLPDPDGIKDKRRFVIGLKPKDMDSFRHLTTGLEVDSVRLEGFPVEDHD